MGTRRRLTRDESKAQTRAELIRVANRLFLRNGYAATTLAAIADEASVTKGAVYSNFESKEDLFLAVLEHSVTVESAFAAHGIAEVSGDSPADRAAALGQLSGAQRPSRRHVALFLEANSAALRSDRVRAWVAAHNRRFFESSGRQLATTLGLSVADAAIVGLVAQSLHVGLMMHGAFDDDIDDSSFARAYEMLSAVGGPVRQSTDV